MEHTSDLVAEGKLIHESSYPQRSDKLEEIEIDGVKVDYYDPHNKIIHEIKKSDKIETAHRWQLKYYIYIFEKNGIDDVSGILEYPALRKKESVLLTGPDRQRIKEFEIEIHDICRSDICPSAGRRNICRSCSYFEFCYSAEPD